MSEETYKTGHPILAVVLGILGIAAALLTTLLAGVIGGAVAGLLGLAALLIGLSARKNNGKGWGGIITGALAIILAVMMTVSTISVFNQMKEKAAGFSEEAPLVVKSLNNPALGLIGMVISLPRDEGTADELIKQFNLVQDKMK